MKFIQDQPGFLIGQMQRHVQKKTTANYEYYTQINGKRNFYLGKVFQIYKGYAVILDDSYMVINYAYGKHLIGSKAVILSFYDQSNSFWRDFKKDYPDYEAHLDSLSFLYLHLIGEMSFEKWQAIT